MNIFICSQSTKNLHLFGILVCSLLAPLSCIKARSDSSLKVIAGNEDNQSLPSTVKLEFPSQDNQVIENCTGAFVRDDLILTAAHCGVRFQGQVRITTIFNNSKIISSSDKPIIHPKYDAQIATETDMTKMTPYDLAFIKVPAGSAPTSAIAKLASSPAKKGDQVTILGYGFSDRAKTSKLGSRRIGSTTIGDIRDNGMLVTAGAWTGDGDQSLGSSIMQGDSGGALYNAQSKEIVGVVSANSNTSVNSFGISYFTNIATEDSRSFIQTVMGTAPSQQSDASIKVGGYSCQQQKDWGKCGETWMTPACDAVCNPQASAPKAQNDNSNMVGGYSCQQQKDWGKCGETWMTPACDAVCKPQAPAPKAQNDSSNMVGGYSCQQQKDWGKCDQPWMYPVCQATCQSQAQSQQVHCSMIRNGQLFEGHSQAECNGNNYGTEPLLGPSPTQVGGPSFNCSYSKNGKNVQGHSQAECEQLKNQLGI